MRSRRVAPSDAIIPVADSRALFDAWSGTKKWIEVRDADHNSIVASRELWGAVTRFLR